MAERDGGNFEAIITSTQWDLRQTFKCPEKLSPSCDLVKALDILVVRFFLGVSFLQYFSSHMPWCTAIFCLAYGFILIII